MALSFPLLLFLIACVIASYTDVRWRRVPNVLTYGTLTAIVVVVTPHGIAPLLSALGSAIVVVFAGSVVFGLGWLGGGDIKLLATGAAAMGFPAVFVFLLYVALIGGIIGAIYALRERRLRTTVLSVAWSVVSGTNVTPATASRRIPYALAICGGAFAYAASESFAPWLRLVY